MGVVRGDAVSPSILDTCKIIGDVSVELNRGIDSHCTVPTSVECRVTLIGAALQTAKGADGRCYCAGFQNLETALHTGSLAGA